VFSNGSGFAFTAIDSREKNKPAYLWHRMRLGTGRLLDGKQAEASFRCGVLPAALWKIESGSVSHLHMHMFTGNLSESRACDFVGYAARILRKDGMFFMSFDYEMFDQEFVCKNEGNVIAAFENILRQSFRLVFRSFIRDPPESPTGEGSLFFLERGQKLEHIVLPEAVELSANFGIGISARNPQFFFRRFSDCAERWGYYFAIAKKE